jgi:hypothetical protein
MEPQISPFEPVLDQLLSLNPWAVPLWKMRRKLVDEQRWNIRFRNQAGNETTDAWLSEFRRERIKASRTRLMSCRSQWETWSSETKRLLSSYELKDEFPRYAAGSGTLSETMPPYGIDSLWADMHLLADVDLSGEVFEKTVDLKGYIFPASLLAAGIRAEQYFNIDAAKLGSHSTFAMSRFNMESSFQDVMFGSWCGFVGTQFHATTTFENSRFGFEGSFSGTSFQGAVSFKCAVFEGSAPFCGAHFQKSADFSNAHFLGRTDFGDSTFDNGAIFEDTWFPDIVCVHGLSKDVIQAIVSADHAKTRGMQ